MKNAQNIVRSLSYIFLIISSFIMIYPVLFMALGSLPPTTNFLKPTILPIPNTLNIALFQRALGRWHLGCLCLYIATLRLLHRDHAVGRVDRRLHLFQAAISRARTRCFLLFLSGMVMPGILMMVPMYLLMAWFPFVGGNNILGQGGHGLIGQWPVLFVYGWVPPFAIFLLKQSFDMLPTEYEDAAKMDGAGIFTIIFRVYGPLLKPPIVALIIVTFLGVWNDYLWPSLTIAGHPEFYPIAYRIQSVILSDWSPVGTTDYPAVMVRTFLATWPPALVYFLLQRYFVQGLVASGLKG